MVIIWLFQVFNDISFIDWSGVGIFRYRVLVSTIIFWFQISFQVEGISPPKRVANTKGKTERIIEFLKNNFLHGQAFSSIEKLNFEAKHCNGRLYYW